MNPFLRFTNIMVRLIPQKYMHRVKGYPVAFLVIFCSKLIIKKLFKLEDCLPSVGPRCRQEQRDRSSWQGSCCFQCTAPAIKNEILEFFVNWPSKLCENKLTGKIFKTLHSKFHEYGPDGFEADISSEYKKLIIHSKRTAKNFSHFFMQYPM